MKLGTLLSLTLATVGAFALSTPAQAQQRGHGGGNSGMSHGGGMQGGNFNRGGNFRGGNFHHGYYGHGYYRRGSNVNFYFGGFGYPYYGYPYYAYGYPYYGYPYYAYATVPAYTYDPQGVYEGRVVQPTRTQPREDRDAKDVGSVEARVQERLAQAGYYRGSIDGVVGENTRRAIRSYERDNNLRVDGRIDDELLSSMGIG